MVSEKKAQFKSLKEIDSGCSNTTHDSNDTVFDLEQYALENLQSKVYKGYEYELFDTISDETGQAAAVTLARMQRTSDKSD